jgi:predicted Zn-dependent protease with MMP-like domain
MPRRPASDPDFENLLESTIQELPRVFREKLRNIAIVVEDYPSDDLLDSLEVPEGDTLFGLYQGVPLTERGHFEAPLYPDQILIFRRAIEDACDSPEEVREELRITLMHEIAHFFGMDDDELEEAGY